MGEELRVGSANLGSGNNLKSDVFGIGKATTAIAPLAGEVVKVLTQLIAPVTVTTVGTGKVMERLASYAYERLDVSLAERAAKRTVEDLVRKQTNIERVHALTAEAHVKLLPAPSEGEVHSEGKPVDMDKLFAFQERYQNVSDEELARLCARLLAGEIHAPGTYGRRAMDAVAGMDSSDAELFQVACDHAESGNGVSWSIKSNAFMGTPFEEVHYLRLIEMGLLIPSLVPRTVIEEIGNRMAQSSNNLGLASGSSSFGLHMAFSFPIRQDLPLTVSGNQLLPLFRKEPGMYSKLYNDGASL